MTIIKSNLHEENNELNFSISFNDLITKDTNDYELDILFVSLQKQLLHHLLEHRDQKITEGLKTKFSNFNTPRTTTQRSFSSFQDTPQEDTIIKAPEEYINDIPLYKLISVLKELNIIYPSALNNVYSFKNSPYTYSINTTEWSSPFGTKGTSSLELVNDIFIHLQYSLQLTITEFLTNIVKAYKGTSIRSHL